MTIENGVIRQLSVSQVESFDEAQNGGCERKWWFNVVHGLRPDQQTTGQSDGDKGHALLATYLKTGEMPAKRAKLGKAVTGAIVKGELPKPGADLLVELRFDGQPKFNAAGEWVPLDTKETLWLGGVPWEGFIDLTYRRGDVPVVLDHKFSSDIHTFAKAPGDLIKTVQMPVYVWSQRPYWPDAKLWDLMHHNVSRTGVESFIRRARVTIDQVRERIEQIEGEVVPRMKTVAQVTEQGDVKPNRRSCETWAGCAHQSICSAYKRRSSTMTTTATLSPADAAIFSEVDEAIAAEAAPPPPPAPAPEAKQRRMNIVDAPSEPPAAPVVTEAKPPPGPPPVASKPPEEKAPVCACSTQITKENGSKLQDGTWKHVGCPLDAPPAAPRELKPKNKAKAPTPEPAPAATAELLLMPRVTPPVATLTKSNTEVTFGTDRSKAVADVLESIARLLRA